VGLGNGLSLHLFGKQWCWSLHPKRDESWQSAARTRRILLSTGFGDVSVKRGDHFVITALKMKGSPKSNTLRFDS